MATVGLCIATGPARARAHSKALSLLVPFTVPRIAIARNNSVESCESSGEQILKEPKKREKVSSRPENNTHRGSTARAGELSFGSWLQESESKTRAHGQLKADGSRTGDLIVRVLPSVCKYMIHLSRVQGGERGSELLKEQSEEKQTCVMPPTHARTTWWREEIVHASKSSMNSLMIDTLCLCYSSCSSMYVSCRRIRLPRTPPLQPAFQAHRRLGEVRPERDYSRSVNAGLCCEVSHCQFSCRRHGAGPTCLRGFL